MATLYEKAVDRIMNTPQLHQYRDIILSDWAEGDKHLHWVITAPVGEIVDWAQPIREAEDLQS